MKNTSVSQLSNEFITFVNASPSPFHAVQNARERLVKSGFTELKEKQDWNLLQNGKYFVTRNQTSLAAFVVGGKFRPGNGVSIIGAHTDSPCLKLKPVSKKESNGYLQVGVQLYGGGLWHTWFDRDLSVAGRVICRTVSGGLESRLVKIDAPILRIPTLAIHLDRGVNEKFVFNNENQLFPILASAIKDQLNAPAVKSSDREYEHHSGFLRVIAEQIECDIDDIVDFELCLYDTQPSTIGGLYNEYIFSPRLDNLVMSFCSMESLIASVDDGVKQDSSTRLIAMFDNEEIGSVTAQGAASSFILDTLRRIASDGGTNAFEKSVHSSFFISADMAHAIHPNYAEKHESNHKPQMHKGVVIKVNANQRYATNSVTSAILKQIAGYSGTSLRETPIPLQEFVVRNDSPCGSTIGPMLSAKLGMRTVDVGNPQLSMHSIREMGGTDDIKHAVDLFTSFFQDFPSLDAKVNAE